MQIKDLKIANELYSFKDNEEKVLEGLSKINIFIGENNSGKSLFIRSVFQDLTLKFIPAGILDSVNKNVSAFKKEADDFANRYHPHAAPIQFLNSKLPEINEIDFLVPGNGDYLLPIFELKDAFETYKRSNVVMGGLQYSFLGTQFSNIIDKYFPDLDNNDRFNYEFVKIYIPVLRGIRPLQEAYYRDFYKECTKRDYFPDLEFHEDFDIYTGLTLFKDIKRSKLSDKRRLIKEFEYYLSEYFFNGREVELTPYVTDDEGSEKDDVIAIKIGDEKERRIYELGDGLQEIIILTFPLFLNKNKDKQMLFFIDEPELHLHPGLQRKLLDTFVNYDGFENCQFFITTHSTHFLDVTFDFDKISVFSVNKKLDETDFDDKDAEFIIENRSIDDKEVLDLIGAKNTSPFSKCMILIEGFTDRLYIKRYFDIYQREMRKQGNMEFYEDYHYSFLEYCGSSIANSFLLNDDHYSENTLKLKESVFVIMDGDKTGSNVAEELSEKLEDNFYLLSCKEIENLTSEDTLLRYLKEKKGYAEEELNDFEESDYQKIDCSIRSFIENEILNNPSRRFQMSKNSFCEDILDLVNVGEDISNLAWSLCEEIYNFIDKQNKL